MHSCALDKSRLSIARVKPRGNHILSYSDDVSEHLEHLVGAGSLVDALDDVAEEVGHAHPDGRPLHLVVPPLQQLVKGTR